MSDAGRPRDFEPVSSSEAEKMIAEGAKTFATVMAWSKEQKHVINTHLSYFSQVEKNIYLFRPKELDPVKLMDELAQLPDSDVFFSVSLMRANLFFKTRYLGHDKGGLKFKFPEKVFKVQRRKDVRFSIPEGYVLRVEYQDPLHPENRVSRKTFDISAGGLSILVPEDEGVVYQKELLLKNISFTVKQKAITTDAKVCHVSALKNNPKAEQLKVGLQFTNIRAGDSQHIATYVFEEMRKYYARYM